MKKTLMPLLIAAAVALSACGQDLSGGDWRTTGVVQAAGTISRSGADTDVLVCVHEGDAVFYRDSADQELFGQVVYPMDVQDPWDTFAAIDFADRNGDGDGDVAMTFTDSEGGDVWMVWFWDADTGEYVFQPEESGSTVTAEWLRWEDLAEDCTTWQGEDGGMLALRVDEALYTYRTWYGRTGHGFAGAGVAAHTGRALLYLEAAKAHHLHLVSALHGGFHCAGKGGEGRFAVLFAQTAGFRHGGGQFGFIHGNKSPFRL